MKKILNILLIILLGTLSSVAAESPSEVEILLNRLDSLIANKENIENVKQTRIHSLLKQLDAAASLNSRLAINSALYDEYYVYNADSAKVYLDENIKIAEELNDHNLATELLIKKSFLEAATGMMFEARRILRGIDASSLPHDLKKEYYGQMVYIFGLLGNYTSLSSQTGGWNHYYEREQTYKDSLRAILVPGDRNYLWYLGWGAQELPRQQQDSVMTLIAKELKNSELSSREAARLAYVLAVLYKEQGNKEKFLEYMAKSAIADVAIGNREIASLQELSKEMFDENNIDRAYAYSSYSLDAALNYPNRVRALTLLPLQNEINRAYRERSHRQEDLKRHLIIALCIVAGILAVAIGIIFQQLRRRKRQNGQISETNERLNKRNIELTQAQEDLAESNSRLNNLNLELQRANTRLREANYVKEEYVGYVFAICSLYIKKLEELRQSINAKASKKQWKEIEEMTGAYHPMAKIELKEFYDNFDSIFLHIFPDFVAEFNSLLRPEEQITLKDGEQLNTELRIYALIRLGILDSVKIADFLHCSPQTVYNYRFKMRNKAKGDKETFTEQVKNIGKAAIK